MSLQSTNSKWKKIKEQGGLNKATKQAVEVAKELVKMPYFWKYWVGIKGLKGAKTIEEIARIIDKGDYKEGVRSWRGITEMFGQIPENWLDSVELTEEDKELEEKRKELYDPKM